MTFSLPIDTTYAVETPEGVDLIITPAGLYPRILAYLIDFAFRAVFLIVVGIVLMYAGTAGTGILLVLSFLAEWFYPVFFETYKSGITPGKKTMGLCVLHDDGTPIGFSSSLLRNLLRVVDFMPFGYFLGIVSLTLNNKYKRLGDLAAGTIVVYHEKLNIAPSEVTLESEHFVLPKEILQLSAKHQNAILEFGERSSSLSMARQVELAAIISEFMGAKDNETRDILIQSAEKLLGR